MKKTDMEKLAGLRIENAQHRAGSPARFGNASAAAQTSRREQRRLDQAQGLIPLAVKIDSKLVDAVRTLAGSRAITVDAMVTELLRKGLEA